MNLSYFSNQTSLYYEAAIFDNTKWDVGSFYVCATPPGSSDLVIIGILIFSISIITFATLIISIYHPKESIRIKASYTLSYLILSMAILGAWLALNAAKVLG